MQLLWNKIYLLNEESIDKEHKGLFDIANEAFLVVDHTKRLAKVKTIIQKLYNYTKVHFDNEERFMQSIGYPNLEEHKKLHKESMQEISNLIKILPTTHISKFERELARFLFNFANQHILKHDMKIKEWQEKNDTQKARTVSRVKFSLNDTALDDDHRMIFELYKELDEYKGNNFAKYIQDIKNYENRHFKNEEELMEKISFDERDEHRNSHESLSKKIVEIEKKIDFSDKKRAKQEILAVIYDIISHIQNEDKKISKWMQELLLMKIVD